MSRFENIVSMARQVDLLNLPQAAAVLDVDRAVVREVLYESGLVPHSATGGHWHRDDVLRLATEPTEAVSAARGSRSADPQEPHVPRRRRAKNPTPDAGLPEVLDRIEAASVLGVLGCDHTLLARALDDAGLTWVTEPRQGWPATALRDLAADPAPVLDGLQRRSAPEHCSTYNAARALGIGTRDVGPLMLAAGFAPLAAVGYWRRDDVERQQAEPSTVSTGPGAVDDPSPVSAAFTQPFERTTTRVVAHLGPTNSGKTHGAIQALVARAQRGGEGKLVYASPLRMMAQEVHTELSAQLGSGAVGLITGDERVNEDARVLSTTTELAPMRGDMLCLDEVQWCADPLRGRAWSSRLIGAGYEDLRLIGSADALPVLRLLFGKRLELLPHERMVPLHFIGKMSIDTVLRNQSRTIVIAFRRAAVLAIAGAIQERDPGRPIAVLYGAMPLPARREQIRRVREGEVDIVVSSDVLGHGVNLPCDRILFAETDKWDGRERRDLHDFEIGQIAGRAGRFRLSAIGEVGVLGGIDFVRPDERLVSTGFEPQLLVEEIPAFRRLDSMFVGPELEDLGCEEARQLPDALRRWYSVRRNGPPIHHQIENPRPLVSRLEQLDKILARRGSGLEALSATDAWRLTRSPLSSANAADREVLGQVMAALDDDRPLDEPPPERFERLQSLEELEYQSRFVQSLRWCAVALPQLRLRAATLEAHERTLADQYPGFFMNLAAYGERNCQRCSRPCSPLHHLCVACTDRARARSRPLSPCRR